MKPVAWMNPSQVIHGVIDARNYWIEGFIPLYTASRELSDEEIIEIRDSCYVQSGIDEWEFDDVVFARAILKKASEK